MKVKPLISVKNLSIYYQSSAPLVKNLDFQIREGDFICLVGPNGAGKSTLVKVLLKLQKPQAGRVEYHRLQPTEIGYMPQETKTDPHFPASVEEIAGSGLLNRSRSPFLKKQEKVEIEEVLEMLHLSELKRQSFTDLSGGQRQKTLLARALLAARKLLILDEPSNNLDHESRQEFYELLKEKNRAGMTILMITHDLDHENLIGNRILALGPEPFDGPAAEYIEKVHHLETSKTSAPRNVNAPQKGQTKSVNASRHKNGGKNV